VFAGGSCSRSAGRSLLRYPTSLHRTDVQRRGFQSLPATERGRDARLRAPLEARIVAMLETTWGQPRPKGRYPRVGQSSTWFTNLGGDMGPDFFLVPSGWFQHPIRETGFN